MQKIGGREVAVPQGKVGANPALAKNGVSISCTEIVSVDALCRRLPMPHTALECQVSTMANSDTRPRPTTGGSTSFQQSEYLVYKEEQCCIRYVLKMKFQSPGGHWH
jgi:hypothetical protein